MIHFCRRRINNDKQLNIIYNMWQMNNNYIKISSDIVLDIGV